MKYLLKLFVLSSIFLSSNLLAELELYRCSRNPQISYEYNETYNSYINSQTFDYSAINNFTFNSDKGAGFSLQLHLSSNMYYESIYNNRNSTDFIGLEVKSENGILFLKPSRFGKDGTIVYNLNVTSKEFDEIKQIIQKELHSIELKKKIIFFAKNHLSNLLLFDEQGLTESYANSVYLLDGHRLKKAEYGLISDVNKHYSKKDVIAALMENKEGDIITKDQLNGLLYRLTTKITASNNINATTSPKTLEITKNMKNLGIKNFYVVRLYKAENKKNLYFVIKKFDSTFQVLAEL